MKKIVAIILFVTAFSSSFCQTGIYGMFYFKGGLNTGTTYPFPIKVSSLGNGKFEITSDLDGRIGNKLEYSGEFVEYDKWEKLYKYRGVEKWYPGGVKRNDTPEYTTETFITCHRNLSDFAGGLKIDPNGMVEDTKIEITQTTTSYWTNETEYYTIVLFNDNTTTHNQKINQSDSTKISLYRAVLKNVLVYDEPSLSSKSFPHDFFDERFACQELKNGFIYAMTEHLGGKIWSGWIHTSSLVKFGECWLENGYIESSLTYDESVRSDSAKSIMKKNEQWIEQSAKLTIESLVEYTLKAKSSGNDSKAMNNNSQPTSHKLTDSAKTVYFNVIADKAYFYNEPNYSSRRSAYMVSGEHFYGSNSKNGFVYTVFTNPYSISTKGWISLSDVDKLEASEKESDQQESKVKQKTDEINNRARNSFGGTGKDTTETRNPSRDISFGVDNLESHKATSNSENKGSSGGEVNGVSFKLEGRSSQSLPKPYYQGNFEGVVIVVQVTVNRAGQVTKAEAGIKGSNTVNRELITAAKNAALQARFNVNQNAPAFQAGTITYRFLLLNR